MKRNKMFWNYLDNTEKWAVQQKSTEIIIILADSFRRKKEKGLSVKPRHSFRYYHRPVYRLSIWNVDPGRQLDTDIFHARRVLLLSSDQDLRDCLDVASYWPSTRGICQPTRTMSAFSDVSCTVMGTCCLVVWNWSKCQFIDTLDMVATPEDHNTWGCWTVLHASLGWVCIASAEPQQVCVARTGDKKKWQWTANRRGTFTWRVSHVFEYYLACRTTAVELPYRQHWNDRVVRDILTAAWDRSWYFTASKNDSWKEEHNSESIYRIPLQVMQTF